MPDITMCKDKECPAKDTCYRFMANPNPYQQSYFAESPRDGMKCGFRMKMTPEDLNLVTDSKETP